jgi:hypothetical protein
MSRNDEREYDSWIMDRKGDGMKRWWSHSRHLPGLTQRKTTSSSSSSSSSNVMSSALIGMFQPRRIVPQKSKLRWLVPGPRFETETCWIISRSTFPFINHSNVRYRSESIWTIIRWRFTAMATVNDLQILHTFFQHTHKNVWLYNTPSKLSIGDSG